MTKLKISTARVSKKSLNNLNFVGTERVQQQFNTNVHQNVDPNPDSAIIGIVNFLVYIGLFMYIYGSAFYKRKLSLHVTKRKGFTLSEGFQYSEKIGTTVFLILSLGIIQCLYYYQKIYDNDYQRGLIIALNYINALIWLLFFYVVPEFKYSHGILAIFVLVINIYTSVTIYNLYKEFYYEKDIQSLEISNYIIIATFSIMMFLFIIRLFVNSPILGTLIAISEIISLLSFAIFILCFSLMPPLVSKDNIQCYLK